MTKDETQQEFLKLLAEKVEKDNIIIVTAKNNGLWKQGLDSNNELFFESNKEYLKKIELLKSHIDKKAPSKS